MTTEELLAYAVSNYTISSNPSTSGANTPKYDRSINFQIVTLRIRMYTSPFSVNVAFSSPDEYGEIIIPSTGGRFGAGSLLFELYVANGNEMHCRASPLTWNSSIKLFDSFLFVIKWIGGKEMMELINFAMNSHRNSYNNRNNWEKVKWKGKKWNTNGKWKIIWLIQKRIP